MTSAESIRALDVVFSQKSRWLLCYDGMKVIQECKYTSTYCDRTSLCYDGIKLIQKHKVHQLTVTGVVSHKVVYIFPVHHADAMVWHCMRIRTHAHGIALL